MKNLHNKNSFNTLPKLGIFSISLFAVASAIYLYSPVLGSNAADSSVDVNVDINPIISLSLDTNALNFSMTPTSAGVFESKPIVATVDTNSTGGYELYFSSIDDQTAMTSLTSESTITSTFANTVTSTTMAANTWGYSLDNTDFSKIPTLTNHVAIKNLDHLPTTAEKVTTTNIGVKIDSTLASGTYNKKVLFSAVAHPSAAPTLGNLTSMQQMTSEICSASAVGESATLSDARDSNTYTIKKLADGNCWMTQNLKIINKTLSPTDSDVPEDYTIEAKEASAFICTERVQHAAYIAANNEVLYNYHTAVAGMWERNYYDTTGDENATSTVCPKGWTLPSEQTFETLITYYDTVEKLTDVPGFYTAGGIYDSKFHDNVAEYWSRTASGASGSPHNAIVLSFRESNGWMTIGSDSSCNAYPIRCIAR